MSSRDEDRKKKEKKLRNSNNGEDTVIYQDTGSVQKENLNLKNIG